MTPKQEEALREYLQEAIMPLIEQVLVKKLGQAMLFAADQLMQPKREWIGLTDEQIHIRYKAMRGDKSPRYIEIYRDCENAHGIKGK